MSQATILERPYVNSNLFSGHYLDERLQLRDEWECDDEAAEIMDELQSLYELEDRLVEGYNEDPLIDNWIDEILDILGFGTQVETSLPESSNQELKGILTFRSLHYSKKEPNVILGS